MEIDNIPLTEAELSGIRKVSHKTLSNWRWKGAGLEYIKMGRFVRYKKAALEFFNNGNTI
jgi:hypothetical protein